MDNLNNKSHEADEDNETAFISPKRIDRILDLFTNIFVWTGVVSLALIMLLTLIDIFGRKLFKLPLQPAIELITLILVIVTIAGIFTVTAKMGNIGVDILTERFPPLLNKLIASFSFLIGFVMFAAMSWQLWIGAKEWADRGLATPGTPILGVPYYPFKYLMSVGCALIALVVLNHFRHSLIKLTQTFRDK